MSNELEFPTKVVFTVERNKHFEVTIESWLSGDKWQWNVYAVISQTHPLFNDIEAAKNLPFNGGCTFDRFLTATPTGKKEDWYSFQREFKSLKVGSDYAHIHDNYDNHPSPFDFIPHNVRSDANDLVNAVRMLNPSD